MADIRYKFDTIKDHFRDNALYYFFACLFTLVGLGIGLYISLTGYRYTALLSSPDKNMFAYITGTAPYTSIFYSRLINVILCVAIIFVLSLTKYTAVLGYIFLSYQMSLIVLSSAAIISLYGLTGVLNVIFFVVPVNIANYALMTFGLGIGLERARAWSNYRLRFSDSFRETGFMFKFIIYLIALVVICLLHSFVLPIFLKSFVVINY